MGQESLSVGQGSVISGFGHEKMTNGQDGVVSGIDESKGIGGMQWNGPMALQFPAIGDVPASY